jgi:hypothetical protein
MLQIDPADRVALVDLLLHRWLSEGVNTSPNSLCKRGVVYSLSSVGDNRDPYDGEVSRELNFAAENVRSED